MTDSQPTSLGQREIIFGFGKRLRGLAYDQALQFLINRDGKSCKKCGKDDQGQTLDHVVPDANPLHSSNNLQILCFKCNSAKGARKPSNAKGREGEKLSWEHTKPYSNEEGEKHEIMRARWDKMVEEIPKGTRNLKSFLAERAPGQLGLGSSKTYTVYLNEDIASGKFEKFRDDGKLWVERT